MRKRFGVAVVVAGALAVPVALAPAPSHAAPVPAVAAWPSASEAEATLFTWLNQERAKVGVPPMVRSALLDPYAATWSEFMAGGNCLARGGSRLCHRTDLASMAMATYPYTWTKAAENVGLVPFGGTMESLHKAFMNSTGHRMNMLDSALNAVGIAVRFDASNTLFVTYEFVAVKGDPANPPPNPAEQLAAPPPGATPADTFLLWINQARADAGLAPVARNVVLDREAQYWAERLAAGAACRNGVVLCHRTDMSTVARTVAGRSNVRWWAENVGMRKPGSLVSQFLGFMNSDGHRKNILAAGINLAGIGYAQDPVTGRTFTVFEFVTAKNLSAVTPPGGGSCGWVPSTLTRGATGAYVRSLQCALTAAGVYSGPIDGSFTTDVGDAVKAFQQQNGLRKPSRSATLTTRRLLGVA